MPYVVERWMGGIITQLDHHLQPYSGTGSPFQTARSGEINRLTKKEGLLMGRKIARLELHLSGVRLMKKVPDLVFVVDVMREATAVHEANIRDIPVIALVDTNCDPRDVDYIIPSNDDAIRAIKLLVGKVADAVIKKRCAQG